MDLVIYCDESDDEGKYYSNFYGGALVRSVHLKECIDRLESRKFDLNLLGEAKWNKVTENYLDKYLALMDEFFDIVAEGKIKVRIMFRQNACVATNLTQDHVENTYFILYYQFIKHAFGLKHCNPAGGNVKVRIYFDELPDKKDRCDKFKQRIHGLSNLYEFESNKIIFPYDQLAEVDSKKHVILQCLDIVLGAMPFRLNDKHKALLPGKKRRGKRTIAKERLYKHINSRIREMLPNFNVGVSTGFRGSEEARWEHPYRHWLFETCDHEFDPNQTKRGASKA